MGELTVETRFQLLGQKPENSIVFNKDNQILNQNILQQYIADPVKGHVWDLNRNLCLTHEKCSCTMTAFVDCSFTLRGDAHYIQEKIREIKRLVEG
jgi:hypothetical protein